MHLQQTKVESRATGGPQYYFHDVPDTIKSFLRAKGACPVVLQTPYGIARTAFTAVEAHRKLEAGKVVPGKVGHDRIQGKQSIGEAIRHWYGLQEARDFWRIQVDAVIHPEGHFILIPTSVIMAGAKREQALGKVHAPLSFHRDHQSKFWRVQIEEMRAKSSADVLWAGSQIERVVAEHRNRQVKGIQEADLLRASGALSILGLQLSAYLGKGYDCPGSRFQFSALPSYPCPVEIKKRSSGFDYQIARYADLPRAVILCMVHDRVNTPDHIDVIELPALAEHLSR